MVLEEKSQDHQSHLSSGNHECQEQNAMSINLIIVTICHGGHKNVSVLLAPYEMAEDHRDLLSHVWA